MVEVAVIIGEIGTEGRRIRRLHQRCVIALKPVDDGRATGCKLCGQCRIITQRLARGPQEGVAGTAAHHAVRIETITQGNAAIGVALVGAEAHRIFVRHRHPGAGRCRIIGDLAGVAHHRGRLGFGEDAVVEAATLAAALCEDHAPGGIEHHVGHGVGAGEARHVELPARVGAERPVKFDPDGPHLRPLRHGVIEAAAIGGHAAHAAFGLGQPPCGRIFRIEGRVGNVHPAAVVGDRRQTPGRARYLAMVEGVGDEAR